MCIRDSINAEYMGRKAESTLENLKKAIDELSKTNKGDLSLKEYADVIQSLQELTLTMPGFEAAKKEVEDMQTVLKRSFDSNPLNTDDITSLDILGQRLLQLHDLKAQAEETLSLIHI
eukprot:TRINITY_DN21492_c0_g1_i1.p1 TRINITY_DN21492_c0_g1~~TRINITY_DN21492_c0_g1_i1.p1  ORF type:complete len:137 (-),score=60.76 TRINITY_DN21492_c0_g1_i1:58-411(-)